MFDQQNVKKQDKKVPPLEMEITTLGREEFQREKEMRERRKMKKKKKKRGRKKKCDKRKDEENLKLPQKLHVMDSELCAQISS
jgi:hypothetical protein